jgi:hypothetical protein
MLAAFFAVAVAVSSFGPPDALRPHQSAMVEAESLAKRGHYQRARQLLQAEADQASPEAQDLLVLHARMLQKLETLSTSLPGTASAYLPYIFALPRDQFPSAMADARGLAPVDAAMAELLAQPIAVVVEHQSRAVGLMVRGALVDLGAKHGLPLRSATGPGQLTVIIEADEVAWPGSLLEGTGMHSYTSHIVVELQRPGRADITNGIVQQLLGINEARSIDTNRAKLVDRTLTALAVECIRRSLSGELGR